MFTCQPSSVFSWNFRAVAAERVIADVTFDFLTEQGTILHRGEPLVVVKHGPMSGRWTLERDGTPFAEACKPSAFQRRFELAASTGPLVVEAKSAFGRGFHVIAGGEQVVGDIHPAHVFSREAIVDCDASVAERDQLFAFWLVALAWRRAARSD